MGHISSSNTHREVRPSGGLFSHPSLSGRGNKAHRDLVQDSISMHVPCALGQLQPSSFCLGNDGAWELPTPRPSFSWGYQQPGLSYKHQFLSNTASLQLLNPVSLGPILNISDIDTLHPPVPHTHTQTLHTCTNLTMHSLTYTQLDGT